MPIARKLLVSSENKLKIGANGQPADKDCCCGCCTPGNGLPSNIASKTINVEFTITTACDTHNSSASWEDAPNPESLADFWQCWTEEDGPNWTADDSGTYCDLTTFSTLHTPDEVSDKYVAEISAIHYGTIADNTGWFVVTWAQVIGFNLGCEEGEDADFDYTLHFLGADSPAGTIERSMGSNSITWEITYPPSS